MINLEVFVNEFNTRVQNSGIMADEMIYIDKIGRFFKSTEVELNPKDLELTLDGNVIILPWKAEDCDELTIKVESDKTAHGDIFNIGTLTGNPSKIIEEVMFSGIDAYGNPTDPYKRFVLSPANKIRLKTMVIEAMISAGIQ